MKKNSKLLKVLFLFLCFIFTLQGFAQGVTVSGTVIDETDGKSLPGVTIAVKNTTTGTTSDINGNYSLNAPKGSTLVFSFIGYTPQEVIVGDQKTINVVMATSVTLLQEAVVIGYGTIKRGDATGAITTVSANDFNQGLITSPQDLLAGKSAGVVITNEGGAPGSGATIRIRGGSSLKASNDPLIIVDGVPIDNNKISGSSNFLSFMNPSDIESFTVLKDASATAIYGSRASNGVILITTKKGVKGAPFKITYDGNVSVSAAAKFVDVYSGDQIRNIAFKNPVLYEPDTHLDLGSANTDWQKEIFRTAISHDHNIGLTGAIKQLPYRVSLGYTDQQGILKNTDMKRFTGALSLNPTFFKDDLKVNLNLKGMNTHHNFGADGAVGSAINMDPSHPVYVNNPETNNYFQWYSTGASLGTPNPVEQLMEADNKAEVNRFIGNIQLDYTIPFLRDLRANLNLATDYTKSDGHNNRPTTSPGNITNYLWGQLTDFNGKNQNKLLDFYLNYVKDIPSINSKIDVTGGYSWQYFKLENFNYQRGYVNNEIDPETGKPYHPYVRSDSTRKINELQLVSFLGRLNYSFMDRYLFTATVRDDGSSRFAKENRWGVFPAVALAWKINEEAFLKNLNIVSDLKLRLGWGITGQQDVGDKYYPYLARYVNSTQGNYYLIDNQYITTLRPDAYDPKIKWEETTTQNIGLDFGFFKDRLTGSFDLYKRVTKDLLNNITIPTGSNFSNTLLTNVGSLENRGMELSLNLIPILAADHSLNIGFNVTHNTNEITKLIASDDPNFIGILEGEGMTGEKQVTRVGYAAHSFFVNKQIYDLNGNPIEGLYEDLSGQGGTVNGNNKDKYIYHNPTPDYTFGLSARYNYKNFDIAISSRANLGNYVYNQVAAGASYDQMYQIGYWKNQTTLLDKTNFVSRQFTSDYFVENASFIKLDYISAGYRFQNIANKLSARVSFTVQNVFTITKYTGLDPEVSNGIDNNFYPRPRTFMVGISLGY
ncbi:MAG: SusC/RagA family TonB-linked outer membrane protein [Omnitrophica WOR_2 bacterium]|jgi:iron complex outermembrane receptor protein